MEQKTLIILLVIAVISGVCFFYIFQARQAIYRVSSGNATETLERRINDLHQTVTRRIEIYREKENLYRSELVQANLELIAAKQRAEKLSSRVRQLLATPSRQSDSAAGDSCDKLKTQ